MKLDIYPIVTSRIILQLLVGAKIITVDNKVDRDREQTRVNR